MIIKKSCKVICVLVVCFSQFYFFSNAFASMECGNSRFQGTIYGDFQEAAESACVHQSGTTSVDYIDYYEGGSSGAVHCQSCFNGTCEPWMGWGVSCRADEFYADFSDLDTEDQTNAKSCPSSPNPINLITGNKYKIHADIQSFFNSDLRFRPEFIRTYNSQLFNVQANSIGNNWQHTYQRYLKIQDSFSSGFNESYASQGQTSNPMQTSVYSSEYSACVEGFQEFIASISPYSVLNNLRNGTPRWEKQVCRVYVGGRYVVTIPIRSHRAGQMDIPVALHSIRLYRQNGRVLHFIKDLSKPSEMSWKSADPLVEGSLEQILIEDVTEEDQLSPFFQSMNLESIFKYTDENKIVEIYNNEGELLRLEYPNGVVENLTYISLNTIDYTGNLLSKVENNLGKYIELGYDSNHRIQSITNDENNVWSYVYDLQGNLSVVKKPDGTEKIYHYENLQYPYFLTGETDERGVRYSSFIYQSDGRAIISYLGSPDAISEKQIERVTVNYGGGRNNRVTDSRGNKTTYHFPKESIQGLVTKIDGPECNYCSAPDMTYEYNADYKEFYFNTEPVFLMSKIEFGSKTVFGEYNSRSKPELITEAVGAAEERQKIYTYDDKYSSKIAAITETSVYSGAEKVTRYTYDGYANITDLTITGFKPDGTPVSRASTFKYDGPFHQLSEVNGPRTDVNDITYFDYYLNDVSAGNNRARLSTVRTHAGSYLKQNIQYTTTGKVASEDRANNLHVSYVYYPGNDRLKDIMQTDTVSGAVRTVRYTYLATGEVETITQGADSVNAVTLTLAYDNARRLTRITDGLNNYIEYILDTEGNIEKENIHDTNGVLKKSLAQTFDSYNRLESFTQVNEGKTIDFNPDGTINTITDGKSILTDYSYDSLKRLSTVTQDKDGINPSTANALTQYTYDTQDNLTKVVDANNGETSYVYDDLGNLLSRTSPDTGTVTYQHDEAGNIVQAVDAKSQLFTYAYDVFNRLTSIDVDGTVDDALYTYDSCTQGFGYLCKTQRNNSQLSYQYNAFGEVTSLAQSLTTWAGYNKADNNVSYSYDEVGYLKSITYPSGAVVNYSYNAAGKIDNVNLDQNGIVKTLSLSVNYLPFGEESIQTYGNGMNIMGFYDQAYRPFIVGDPALYFEYIPAYDANGNINMIRTGSQGVYSDSSFSFDEHQRLVSSAGFHGEFNYSYDEVGNKLTQIESGAITPANYSPNSNRLENLAGIATNTDENGNISNLRGMTLAYTIDNRLKSTNTGASFEYHAQGQRSIKRTTAPDYAGTLSYSQTTSYVYGLNGELIAEVGPTGRVKKEYVYLNNKLLAMLDHKPTSDESILKADLDYDGEISIEDFLVWYFNHRTDEVYEVTGDGIADSNDITAVVNCALTQGNCVSASSSTDIYYVHNDHLGTPKLLTNSSREAVWSAKATPFGKATVNNDVDDDGVAVEFNIRQPGQYYDRESGLYYNYYRYYDPETGRYITSDPIGLAGGVNTYAYVGNNPLKFSDPLGLFKVRVGGTSVGVDYSTTLYDSNRGWFPDSETTIGRSTTLGGGGISLVFDTDIRASNVSECDKVGVSVGLGQYLGISTNNAASEISLNFGFGIALPITINDTVGTTNFF